MISVLRTFLNVGRVSNLPTVWSNCLAGWWLGGATHPERLPYLFLGSTFLYLGGTFLNDVFDINFDRQHRRARPIPAGAIALDVVRWSGFFLLGLGILDLFFLGSLAAMLGILLLACILLYNSLHRLFLFSPVLLGMCRLLLYLIAAATSAQTLTGRAVWCGLVVACYIIGTKYFKGPERTTSPAGYWPFLVLFSPVFLALIMNAEGYLENALLVSAVLVLWILQSLRYTLWGADREPHRTSLGFQSGIAFVDWLAAADAPRGIAVLFLLLFAATLAFQQWDRP